MKSDMAVKKQADYGLLVAERKTCRKCHPDLTNQAAVDGGCHDSSDIGAWSRWQGNLNASLMVVGQDWGGVTYFRSNDGQEGRSQTNDNLVKLIRGVGISIGAPRSSEGRNAVFFTNAILCLKCGPLQAPVQTRWFHNCSYFLKRQIEIVRPRVVVALGEKACRSILSTYGQKAGKFSVEAGNPNGRELIEGVHFFAMYHCGARVTNTTRTLPQQQNDWLRVRQYLGDAPG